MSAREGTRFCCVCDKPITGKAEPVERFSSSGARPDGWRHPTGDPGCKPAR